MQLHSQLALVACLGTLGSGLTAGEGPATLQGVFCNAEAQIDATIGAMRAGAPPQVAVEAANREAIVCSYIDRLGFVVEGVVALADGGSGPLTKHRGLLIGVVAGDRLRPVAPPVEVFFVTPDRVVATAVERGA